MFFDVVTREIGIPWLWLQQVTTGFFAWGVFIGAATATRRHDHLNLVEITKGMTGAKRTVFEVFNRLVVLAVAVIMLIFGIQNGLDDLRQLPHAVADPADVLHRERSDLWRADLPVLRRADRQRLAPRL